MVEYINQHQTEFWLVAGFALLVLEVLVGFAAGVFLFAGLGALITGGLMFVGVLPETWVAGISCTGISSGLSAVVLWQPLRNLQGNKPIEKDNSSDFVGHEFVLSEDVTQSQPGTLQYSGIQWRVELDAGIESLAKGSRVTVVSVEVGAFKVQAL
ncbi:NfeD family protein [Simiduia aestuariiviva]|uniref:NfeD-like C-terminal domain-containing protein n=1 Tax=Simiduia aestuariiviva TaxID=1510459 RepID=A0A839UJ91_9GAMM|nr:NfeD family protein [Simiduia aestuariiviva]MBB3167633.1 hypothetical protein [Simiduia aestuariiviva]